METQNNKIVIYQTPDGNTSIDVKLDGNTVWLTQAQMSELFQKDRTVITRHINMFLQRANLTDISYVHFLHIAFSHKPIIMDSIELHREN